MHSDAFLFDPAFTIRMKCSSTISRHLVKLILGGSLYLGPFIKSGRNPLSGIQVRSPQTTCPAGGYRNCKSAQDHDGWMELKISGSEVTWLQLKMLLRRESIDFGVNGQGQFCTLCIKPCGHDTDSSFSPITFKLHI